jgi:hypothetical protein
LPATTVKAVLTASKVVSGSPATVNVIAIDTCGRGKSFDPVITTLEIIAGGRVQQRFEGILAAERYLRVINGSPGLTGLEVVLNGHLFRLGSLAADQSLVADLGAAMNEGDANVVVLTGYGEVGASALVLITDQPADNLILLPEVVELTLAPSGNQVSVSWPAVLADWQLQCSDNAATDWQAVLAVPSSVSGRLTVTVQASHAAQFFRLHPVGQASRLSPSDNAARSTSANASGNTTNPTPQPFQRTYEGILW